MSELAKRLLEDLKEAMRASDVTRRDGLRFLRSEIHNAEISQGRPLTDDEILALIQRQIKQRRDAMEQFAAGNRQDLVEAEKKQIELLQSYLPAPLSREELVALVQEMAREHGATEIKDMGRLMPLVRERVGARAEGREVAEVVRGVLTGDIGGSTA